MPFRKKTLSAMTAILLTTSGLALAQSVPYFRNVAPGASTPSTPPGGNPNNPGDPDDGPVDPLEISISGGPSEGMVGIPLSFPYQVLGGKGPFTLSVPGGPDLSASGGLVAGTPLHPGLFDFAVRVVDANGTIATAPSSILVHPAFAVDTSGPTNVMEGTSATISISSTGGKAPVTYGMVGNVPGMIFDGTALAGYPSVAGSFDFTLWAQDSFLGQRIERSRTLSVSSNPNTLSLSAGQLNLRPGDIQTKTPLTNVPNPEFTLIGAPSYITIPSPTTGMVMIAAPSVTERTEIPAFRIRVQNSQNPSQYREIDVPSIGVARPALALANVVVTGTIGQPISPIPFALTGAENPGAPAINGFNQLLGLSIVDGHIQGTPSYAGTAIRDVTYTDQADGETVTAQVSLDIAKTLTVSLPSTTSYSGAPGQTLTAAAASYAGNVGAVTWSIENAVAGQPTTGFSISPTGVVSGTSAAAGIVQLYVTASETGQSTRSSGTLTFNFQSADATVARPNSATVDSDSLGYGAGTLVERFYDENDSSGWTIYSGGYRTKPLALYFNTPTMVSCVLVRGNKGGGNLSVTQGGTTAQVGLYTSNGTVHVGLPPAEVTSVIMNFYNTTNGQHARIHEFQAGVMQGGVCVTAP